MRVTLAGATIDRRFWVDDPAATPETTSAAYARISHSPRRIGELRDEAVSELERSRRSNESIVYRMGHSSIAEHAVFNIDVEDCSRLLVEFIEGHRLASFTERSQRYVLFGDKEFQVPGELKETPFGDRIRELDGKRYDLYLETTDDEELKGYFGDRLLEQARYILPLTCPTDLGMTVNARQLEYIISTGAAHPLEEVRALSRELLDATGSLAPSLIKYTQGEGHIQEARAEIEKRVEPFVRGLEHGRNLAPTRIGDNVCSELPCCSDDPESEVLAALIFENSDAPYERCRELARGLTDEKMKELLMVIFDRYPIHSSPPRAFEMMDLTFDLDISASGFAQLKRHRMATLIPQRYRADRWETPEVYMHDPTRAKRYHDLHEETRELYDSIAEAHGHIVAQYALTNANVRQVVFKLNLRELYHFVRLRSDMHAQDEIRSISNSMLGEVKRRYPMVSLMLCGRDCFEERRDNVRG